MSLALSALGVAPDTSYQLIAVFLDGGHQGRAFAIQQAWLAKIDAVPTQAWATLINVAERTGNLGGLRTALAKAAPHAVPTADLSAALLQFLRYQGVQSLFPQAAYLRSDVLTQQPLIGAAWAAAQGKQREAARFLAASATTPLTEWDWLIWENIAASLRGSPAYQQLLTSAPETGRARQMLQRAFMVRL